MILLITVILKEIIQKPEDVITICETIPFF